MLAAILAAPGPAVSIPGTTPPDGSVALANRWSVAGGNPARNGVCETRVSFDDLATAWSFEPKGSLEGEPLVWDGHVVAVENREGRGLHVLRLLDGRAAVKPRVFDTDRPLLPSMWERRILVRSSPTEISILEIPLRGRALATRWKHDFGEEVHALLLFQDEIYVRLARGLQRWQVKKRKPEWTASGEYRGPLVLCGEHLFTVEYDGPAGSVRRLRRSDGRVVGEPCEIGHHPLGKPGLAADIGLHVLDRIVVVRHASPVLGIDGRYNTSLVERRPDGLHFLTLENTITAPTGRGDLRLQLVLDDGPKLQQVDYEREQVHELASVHEHPDFATSILAPTLARGVVLIGARAVDLHSHRVLWRGEGTLSTRVVPARETLLVVDRERARLRALRSTAFPRGAASIQPSGEIWARAVLTDGTVLAGTLDFDLEAGELRRTVGSSSRRSLDDLLVAVDRKGALLFARDTGAEVVRGIELLQAEEDDPSAAAFWAAFASLEADSHADLRIALLRAILDRNPDHQEATDAVRSLLPEKLREADPFVPSEWLDFVEAATRITIELIPGEFQEGDPGLSIDQRQLGAARGEWRPDLQALKSERLLVFTPLAAPGQVARCLSMGELVCETLEQIFAAGEAARDERFRLRLHLFESEEEYRAQSVKAGLDLATLEWTAGHYSPRHDLSRIYLPAEEDAFVEVMRVYAHELTHHWIEQRCPLFSSSEARYTVNTPGYWIVEGFASLVDEFVFDLAGRRVETVDERAVSLDNLAHARELIPWATLFKINQLTFHTLDPEPGIPVVSRWVLGVYRKLSHRSIFYEQATATCQYLFHAEDGKHRAKLMEYVALYYTGRCRPGDVERLFGIPPEELGKRVLKYARKVSGRDP